MLWVSEIFQGTPMADLMFGDCIEKMAEIPAGSIDLVLTDPPYGITNCKWDAVIPFEPMWGEIWRVLKPNGVCALFGSEPFSSALRMSQPKFYKYDWIWKKSRAANFANCKHQPMKITENISVFYRKRPTYDHGATPLDKPVKSSRKNKGGKLLENRIPQLNGDYYQTLGGFNKNLIEFGNPAGRGHLHPTQKPVALLEFLVKTYTVKGETVLDFTMGSGSTGVACGNLDRQFTGIENDHEYFVITQDRLRVTTSP